MPSKQGSERSREFSFVLISEQLLECGRGPASGSPPLVESSRRHPYLQVEQTDVAVINVLGTAVLNEAVVARVVALVRERLNAGGPTIVPSR